MKRVGNIFEKIIDINNIELAIMKASKGKTNRPSVQKILDNSRYYAIEIQKMLLERTYVPSPYIKMIIHDGVRKKERTIFKPHFYPDQCIHWALMLQIEEVLLKKMYVWNCASIKGRGLHYGANHIKKVLIEDRKNTKYALKLDVRKFYPSINKKILKEKFRRIFKDEKLLWLLDEIIDSAEDGVPIGNYTSQWFANFYLNDLDHYIKEELGIKHYIRYMDDMLLFSNNKKELHRIKDKIEEYLNNELDLELKGNWQLFKTESRPIDFLGYRFNRNPETKEVYITLRKSNFLRFKRRIRKISKKFILTPHDASAVISIYGWISKSNGYNYVKKYISEYIDIKKCKEVISNETRKQSKANKQIRN